MKQIQSIAFVLISATFSVPTRAEEPQATRARDDSGPARTIAIKSDGLILREALAMVRANNPSLQAARASIDAARGRRRQAGLYPNPEFEFESEEMPSDSFGDFDKSANAFVLAQEVVTAGKRRAATALAGKEIEVSHAEYALLEREVLTEGKKAFFALLAAQELVTVSSRLLEIARRNADASQRRVDAGDVSPVDAIRARVALSRAQVEQQNARKEHENAKSELLRLMGAPEAALDRVGGAEAFYRLPEPAKEESELQAAIGSHPQFQGISLARESAELELKAARRERWPNIEFIMGVESAPGEDPGNREETFILGAGVALPIFDRNQGAIAEAAANRRKAEHELLAGRQELVTQFRQALRTYVSARQQAERYATEIVPGARKAFDLVNRAYRAGDISQLELLEAQQTLAESELEYVEALGELKDAQAELEGLIGEDLE